MGTGGLNVLEMLMQQFYVLEIAECESACSWWQDSNIVLLTVKKRQK